MKKWSAILASCLVMTLFGCGGGDSLPPPMIAKVPSSLKYDGYIVKDGGTYTTRLVTDLPLDARDVKVGFVGNAESRAFLHFPFAGVLPVGARIHKAYLNIFINDIRQREKIKFAVELLNLNNYVLQDWYWSNDAMPFLKGVDTDLLNPEDINRKVPLEVTSLVVEAQRLQLSAFQFRLLVEDSSRLVEIHERYQEQSPELEIQYY